jgi:hypothetical protein
MVILMVNHIVNDDKHAAVLSQWALRPGNIIRQVGTADSVTWNKCLPLIQTYNLVNPVHNSI